MEFLNFLPRHGHFPPDCCGHQQALGVGLQDRTGQSVSILESYLVGKNRGTSKNEHQGEHNLYAAQGFLQYTNNIAQNLGGEYHDCSILLEEWTRQE